MKLETNIKGIPCLVNVMTFTKVPPDPTTWVSALDFYGYTEIEFEVLDRRGSPAPWLERKLDDEERSRIEGEIADYYAD